MSDEHNLGAEDKFDEKDVLAETVAVHLQNVGIGGVDVTDLEGCDDGTGKGIRSGLSQLDPQALR